MTITATQAQALAAFVARIREDWDQPGILAAIRKSQALGSPAQIGRALCALAQNERLTSPALLSEQGRHWHQDGEPIGPNASMNVRCPEHPINFMPCPLCDAKRCLPDPERHADYLEAKKTLGASRTRTTPTKQTQLTDAESAAKARARIEKGKS